MTDEQRYKLKPCPFCGGQAFFDRQEPKNKKPPNVAMVSVFCCKCAARSMWLNECDLVTAYPDRYKPTFPDSYKPDDGREKVASYWNSRVSEEPKEDKTMTTDQQRADALRLAVTLERFAEDPATVQRLASALHYLPDQLRQDMQAVYAYIKALEDQTGDD